MQCPTCNVALIMSDRHGVEIDYCPKCRGVWLDRGELDKIIERSSATQNHHSSHRHDDDDDYEERRRHDSHSNYDTDHDRHHNNDHHSSHHKKHKKESFLGDLFDF